MRKTISITFGLAIIFCLALPGSAQAQRTVSLQALAHGTGTLVMNGNDKYKITGVLVVLRENGDAQFTLYADIQFFGQGKWSEGTDVSQGVDLKITGGAVKDAKGKGKLILAADRKSIVSLTATGMNASGRKFELTFVAEQKTEEATRSIREQTRSEPGSGTHQ